MTEAQQALLDDLLAALAADPRLGGVWLSGSLGHGRGDAWSDIDLIVEVAETDREACLADWLAGRSGLPESVLAFGLHGRIVSVVTEAWSRYDLHFATAAELSAMNGAGLRRLLGETPTPPARPPAPDTGRPGRVAALIREFLRVLGLLPVAVGRQEWLASQQGYELLRRMAIDLAIEARGVPPADRGGAKALNRLLAPDLRARLEALPAPRARRDELIEANLILARAFLDEARPLAARLGADWPQPLEDATRRHLAATLGMAI